MDTLQTGPLRKSLRGCSLKSAGIILGRGKIGANNPACRHAFRRYRRWTCLIWDQGRGQASGSLENASALPGNLDDETLHVPDDL